MNTTTTTAAPVTRRRRRRRLAATEKRAREVRVAHLIEQLTVFVERFAAGDRDLARTMIAAARREAAGMRRHIRGVLTTQLGKPRADELLIELFAKEEPANSELWAVLGTYRCDRLAHRARRLLTVIAMAEQSMSEFTPSPWPEHVPPIAMP